MHWRHAGKLDGCYVLKTDLMPALATKETMHARHLADLSTGD